MSSIVLATANARYSHSSLALRYLKANLGEIGHASQIMEFTLDERGSDIAEKILNVKPSIVGFSVYLWNVELLANVAAILKMVQPEIQIVLGGPEVGFEEDLPDIAKHADYLVTGEGEAAFRDLCLEILSGEQPKEKIIKGGASDLSKTAFPYALYSDEDIAHRVLYVEATRGCPFGCDFCLAGLDTKVRRFSSNLFIKELENLFEKGARQFKFVDRSAHLGVTDEIFNFFISRQSEGVFVHFEIVPDKLPLDFLPLLKRFEPGSIQLEAGVQSFNPEVTARIGRRQDPDKTETILRTICRDTNAHLHTDLIVGLPGETIESFGKGFDRLIAIGPDEIQVGILKRLRGAKIKKHDSEWSMVYNPKPPYEIMKNRLIDFKAMQRLKRFSRYFDLAANSGNFSFTVRLLMSGSSSFESFLRFSDWLYKKTRRTNAIELHRLAELIFEYLSSSQKLDPALVANSLHKDFVVLGRNSFPVNVMRFVTDPAAPSAQIEKNRALARQARRRALDTRR